MSTQETKLKDIADAIRAKEGSSDSIIANDFPARIAAIQTGPDTSDATATARDILSGETAYIASGKVTGTIPTKTKSNISVSGPTIIIPSGYYGSQVSKSVATATQATPTISVNSSGLITASATQSEGYVSAGTKSATQQLSVKTSSDVTANGATVTVPAGYYTSQVSKSVATATQATPSISVSTAGLITASATQSAGYVSSGTKSATKQLTTQAGKTITPGTSQQTAVASGRYTTGAVYVAGDSDLKAENIKSGVNIFGVTGTLEDVTFYWEKLTLSDPRQSSVTGSLLCIEVDGEFTYEPKVLLAYIYEVRGNNTRAWARGGSIYTFEGIIDDAIEEEWYTYHDVWEGKQGGPGDSSGSSIGASNPSKKVGKTVTFDINLDKDYFSSISNVSRINITALYTY